MSSKAPEKNGDAQELAGSHQPSPQAQPHELLDLNGHLLRAFSRPEPIPSRATNIPGQREGQGTSQRIPHRMTTPELERLTFPEDDLEPGDGSYDALVYQDSHYRHRSEIVGYRAAARKKQTTPGNLGAVGSDVTRSPVGAGHGFGEGDRDSATRFQHEAGSARQPHQERNAGIGQRLADQGSYGAERKRQDGGKGEEGTSEGIAGSFHDSEA